MKIFNKSKEGLFGSSMNWINARLPYLYKNKIYPHWDIRNVNHGNPSDQDRITPHIIEPKKQNANPGETVNLLDIERYQYTDFNEASFYFNHYFELNQSIIDLSFEICKPFDNCLGIHFRGNDKSRKNDKENVPIDNYAYIEKIKLFAERYDFESVFVLSDEVALKEFLKNEILKMLNVPVFFTNIEPVFHLSQKTLDNKLELTKNAVAEMLVLSRCKYVLKNQSAFSSWAKIINPEIKMYRTSKCKQDWFPDYYLPEL